MRRLLVSAALAVVAMATQGQAENYVWQLPPGIAPPEVPADNLMSNAKAELGRRLFYDADLSRNGTISCGTCHEQHRGFTEGNASHPGVDGEPGRRNVMALANVAYFTPLTWADPRLHSLEEQILVPLQGTHPVEMGMAGKDAVLAKRLRADSCYREMFAAAFPETKGRIDVDAVGKALASFERTLISYDSPYDRFRRGDNAALTLQATRGMAVFFSQRCDSCHAGSNFTDLKYHNIGLYNVDGNGAYPARDHGLIEITHNPSDEGQVRTPSLRNVALTGPYMHDGSVKSLGEAIRHHLDSGAMASPLKDKALRGVTISQSDIEDLVAFLQSLSDQGFATDPSFALPKLACGKPNY